MFRYDTNTLQDWNLSPWLHYLDMEVGCRVVLKWSGELSVNTRIDNPYTVACMRTCVFIFVVLRFSSWNPRLISKENNSRACLRGLLSSSCLVSSSGSESEFCARCWGPRERHFLPHNAINNPSIRHLSCVKPTSNHLFGHSCKPSCMSNLSIVESQRLSSNFRQPALRPPIRKVSWSGELVLTS